MRRRPETVDTFLAGRRIAVAGVSRTGQSAGNPVLRKLLESGFDAVGVNPHATSIDGTPCYPALAAIPGTLDGVVIATHPNVSADIVRQAAARGLHTVWFHRSFGQGSVSDEALRECERLGLRAIVGGCPLMYCEPVDVAHKCMRWILDWRGRLPA